MFFQRPAAFVPRLAMRGAAQSVVLALFCQPLLHPLAFAAPPIPPAKTPPAHNTPGRTTKNQPPASGASAFKPLPGNAPTDSVTKSHLPSAPPAAPVFGPPARPAPALPPAAPRRVPLVGALSPALQTQGAHLEVDAAALSRPLPTLWRGIAVSAGESAREAADEAASTSTLNRLRRAAGANLTRINPLAAPGAVTLAADGTPIAHWEIPDTLVQRAAASGQDIIFVVQPPPDWLPAAWNALIGGALRRYRSQTAITRWELGCGAPTAPDRYPAFARLARVLVPGKPLGLNLVSSDSAGDRTAGGVAEGVRRVASVCAQDRLPLDSLAWRLPNSPGGVGDAIRQVRLALSGYPALKGALLLPTLALSSAEEAPDFAARLAATYARLLEAAAPDAPNPLLGVLADTEQSAAASPQDGRAAPSANARLGVFGILALLNRVSGTRLRAQYGDARIGCLAARAQSRTLLLLWRALSANGAAAAPARGGESANAYLLARLHHLAPNAGGGWRITRYAPLSTLDSANASAGLTTPAAPSAVSSAATPVGFPLPAAVCDVPGGGNFLPGELELPTLLAPGEMCLLEIAPAAPGLADLQMTLQTGASSLRGGDAVDIVLTAHNATTKPRVLDVALTASPSDMLPQVVTRVSLGALAPNTTRAYRFALRAPVTGRDTVAWLDAQAGDNHASLAVPILPALEAGLDAPRADVEAGSGTAVVRVRLVNRSRNLLTVSLRAGRGTTTTITLSPNGRPQIARVACEPPSHEAGVYPTALRVSVGERLLQTLRPLVGVPFPCVYAASSPTVDGNLNEWAEAQPLGMGRAEQAHSQSGKAWGGPEDVSAYAYTRWDERNFYFACAVTDDVFYQPFGVAELERGDSVVFALAVHGEANGSLAAPPNAAASRPNGSAGCLVFGMALLRDGRGNLKPMLANLTAMTENGRGLPVGVKDAQVAVRREGSRVFYEAAIPWTHLLSAPPHAGQTLALAVVVNDNDGRNGGRELGSMEWGRGLAEGRQPMLFPALRLVK